MIVLQFIMGNYMPQYKRVCAELIISYIEIYITSKKYRSQMCAQNLEPDICIIYMYVGSNLIIW